MTTYCAGDVLYWYGDPVLLLSDASRDKDEARVTYLRITGDKARKPFEVVERFYNVSEKEPWTRDDLDDVELALVTMIRLGGRPRIEGGFVRWP